MNTKQIRKRYQRRVADVIGQLELASDSFGSWDPDSDDSTPLEALDEASEKLHELIDNLSEAGSEVDDGVTSDDADEDEEETDEDVSDELDGELSFDGEDITDPDD